jgi:ADP-ribose pyrophosphatase YjhB (NUDIX family)
LYREVREETGLQVSTHKLIKVYSRVFPERHDITIVYLCKCKKGEIALNNEHSEYMLLKDNCVDLHPYIIEVIQDYKLDKQA